MRLSGWLVGILFGAFMLDYKENEAKYCIKSKVNNLFTTRSYHNHLFLATIFNRMDYRICCFCSTMFTRTKPYKRTNRCKNNALLSFTKDNMAYVPFLDFLRVFEWLWWFCELVSFIANISGDF